MADRARVFSLLSVVLDSMRCDTPTRFTVCFRFLSTNSWCNDSAWAFEYLLLSKVPVLRYCESLALGQGSRDNRSVRWDGAIRTSERLLFSVLVLGTLCCSVNDVNVSRLAFPIHLIVVTG